ncbi:MAG TPA: aspartate aminotransferase family protein, partial [Acinetobacter nosocomialis]|nr:aspartate aminotransferase family protein [Acinetobacter nosocomialis]
MNNNHTFKQESASATSSNNRVPLNEAQLLADEAKYCSHGDTVHYVNPPKIFTDCQGSYIFDDQNIPYLDLQMWYSAVNFGYKNPR